MTGEPTKVVIRRSHGKSRYGCGNCKKRHIKCDELHPECGNCVKLGKRCDFWTNHYRRIAQGNSKDTLSLEWPPEMQHACHQWQVSGKPSVPLIQFVTSPSWHGFSLETLQYVHYAAIIASFLGGEKCGGLKIFWWDEFRSWAQLAANFDFVAHAIAGSAADRLAFLTKASSAQTDASRHQLLTIKGLNQALTDFSPENSDAILCASILLCLQHRDWRAWKALVTGTQAVVASMIPWADKSVFVNYIEENNALATQLYGAEQMSSTPVGTFDRHSAFLHLLIEGIDSLNRVSYATKDRPELSAMVRDLRDLLRKVRDAPGELSQDVLFRRLHPYRSLVSSFSSSLLNATNGDAIILVVIAHTFATFIALALRFPHINYGFMINVRLQSIHSINEAFERQIQTGATSTVHGKIDYLMRFPCETVNCYRLFFGSKV